MNAKRRLAATAAALALLSTGCGGGDDAASANGSTDQIKVGFITKFPVDFYDTMVTSVKDWNKAHGDVQIVFAQGKSGTDDEGEVAAIQSMVAQGVKAIAITPTSPNVKGELQKAVDKGVKVVLIDNDIPGWTGKSALVATDNLAGGKLAGQWLTEHLKPGAKLAILQGVLGAPSLDARVEGMVSALGTSAQVVAKLPTDCDQTKGLNAAQDILTAHPDVTAIYGACGPPIIGALQAVKAKGKTGQITVVGFDAAPGEVAAIKAGDEAASVAQFPAKMGSMGIETAVKAARGETVAASIDTGTEMVTKDNADEFA